MALSRRTFVQRLAAIVPLALIGSKLPPSKQALAPVPLWTPARGSQKRGAVISQPQPAGVSEAAWRATFAWPEVIRGATSFSPGSGYLSQFATSLAGASHLNLTTLVGLSTYFMPIEWQLGVVDAGTSGLGSWFIARPEFPDEQNDAYAYAEYDAQGELQYQCFHNLHEQQAHDRGLPAPAMLVGYTLLDQDGSVLCYGSFEPAMTLQVGDCVTFTHSVTAV